MITFVDNSDGTVTVLRYNTPVMRINKPTNGNVKTTIFNSYESISLPTIEDTKEYILDMYR